MAARPPEIPDLTATAEAPGPGGDELPPEGEDRFVALGVLGRGAMGEVALIYDQALGRELARKALREDRWRAEGALARFRREARTTARLEHPGVVPVFDLGTLADGRPYYTMQRVRGRTLTEVIREAHRARDGAPVRRLVELVRRTCEVVAYAHSRGVIHRDLKPDNVLVGGYGEVWVVDWGLASPAEVAGSQDPGLTAVGQMLGTPAYVAPELAIGDHDAAGPASDVYTLGGVLYEALSGRPPRGGDLHEVLSQAREGALPPPIPGVDPELARVYLRAMAPVPNDRYPDAGAMLAELAGWLDGVARRARALELVAEADRHAAEEQALLGEAQTRAAQAAALLEPVHSYDPVEQKRPAWALEDEAAALRSQATLAGARREQALQAALRVEPALPEAHARLAAGYHQAHQIAERARDVDTAARLELLLRAHDQGAYKGYLKGEGGLTLVSDPPGVEVWAAPYVLQERRLVLGPARSLGRTPLVDVALPHGSYGLTLAAGDLRAEVPVWIPRGGRWHGVPPGATEPLPIRLLATDDRYVPAGWTSSGGDPEAADGLPARDLWVDGFVMQRDPVTCGAYLGWLNGLIAEGRREEAERHAPAYPHGQLRRDPDGGYHLASDIDEPLDPRTPVTFVSWHAARAYAAWRGALEGLPWRLPHALEWEKAARGVDRRFFPWGDHLEPTWACIVDAFPARARPGPVDAWPLDLSPYGVRGLVGNVRDWCADRYERHGPSLPDGRLDPLDTAPEQAGWRSVRGGAAGSGRSLVRPASRLACPPEGQFISVGFRLARSV